MTREETIGVLTILKSAYPRFYQGMTKGDAETVINLWSAISILLMQRIGFMP